MKKKLIVAAIIVALIGVWFFAKHIIWDIEKIINIKHRNEYEFVNPFLNESFVINLFGQLSK